MAADVIFQLSDLSGIQGFAASGVLQGDAAGTSVSSAGDINGDGYDDVIIGAPFAGEGRFDEGAAYILFGGPGTARDDVFLGTLGDAGFTLFSNQVWTTLGLSVSELGDINGDGIDDLVVGMPGGDASAGEAYVIYGKQGATRADITVQSLSASDGFIIQGNDFGDTAGESVSSAGDVNGDGINDILVGVPFALGNGMSGNNAGRAYVILGKEGATRDTIDLGALPFTDGFVMLGGTRDGQVGHSVSSAGDINGDGYDDVVIAGSSELGEAYVIYGKEDPTGELIDLANLAADDGFLILGDAFTFFQPGWSVSSAGDVNDDGLDDLIVGVPFNSDGGEYAGKAYVVFGKSGATRSNVELASLTGTLGFTIQGDAAGDTAGASVSSAGDINGDGIDDLIIGAPKGDDVAANAGESYVIFGKTGSVRDSIDLSSLSASDGFAVLGHSGGDATGASVSSAGDVNSDGFADLIIGAPMDDGGAVNSGVSYILFGSGDLGVPEAEWKLQCRDGFVGEIGGSGEVFGTAALQDIRVLDMAGSIIFDPSFNKGGDIVRLANNADDWQIHRVGSSAVLVDGDTIVGIPVGTLGTAIVFADGVRTLYYDTIEETMVIGDQSFGTQFEQVTAPADGTLLPGGADPSARATLILDAQGSVVAGGNLDIFGTSAFEQVTLTQGNASLDPSFNKGGDTLFLSQPAPDFLGSRVGSSVLLDGSETDVVIPVGTSGMTVSFPGNDDRVLLYDPMLESILLGSQEIDLTPAMLAPFA